MTRLIESTGHHLHAPAGCHPSITEDLWLAPRIPISVSEHAAAFLLTFPGVVDRTPPPPAEAPLPPDPAPEAPTPLED